MKRALAAAAVLALAVTVLAAPAAGRSGAAAERLLRSRAADRADRHRRQLHAAPGGIDSVRVPVPVVG